MNVFLDIETLPSEDPETVAAIAASVTPPGSMSKPETIAAWEAEKKPALVEEKVRATALDGAAGRILAIGYALDDGEPQVCIDERESIVLSWFFNALEERTRVKYRDIELAQKFVFVGHNLSSFDLRFIWQRAVIHRIKPPIALLEAARAKPWADVIADTMLLWNPERDRRISLDKLCRALGIPSPKQDMDGSGVLDAWRSGEVDRIIAYSKEEVRAVRACYLRMLFRELSA